MSSSALAPSFCELLRFRGWSQRARESSGFCLKLLHLKTRSVHASANPGARPSGCTCGLCALTAQTFPKDCAFALSGFHRAGVGSPVETPCTPGRRPALQVGGVCSAGGRCLSGRPFRWRQDQTVLLQIICVWLTRSFWSRYTTSLLHVTLYSLRFQLLKSYLHKVIRIRVTLSQCYRPGRLVFLNILWTSKLSHLTPAPKFRSTFFL